MQVPDVAVALTGELRSDKRREPATQSRRERRASAPHGYSMYTLGSCQRTLGWRSQIRDGHCCARAGGVSTHTMVIIMITAAGKLGVRDEA